MSIRELSVQNFDSSCAVAIAQLLLLVVTISCDMSRECHLTKHKPPARSNFPLSNFEKSGTIQFRSSNRAIQVKGCATKILKKGRTLIFNEPLSFGSIR